AARQATERVPTGFLVAVSQSIRSIGGVLAQAYYKIAWGLAAPFAWLLRRLEAVEQRILSRKTARCGRLHRLGIWLLRLPVRFARWLLQWVVTGIVAGPVWLVTVAFILGCFFVFVVKPVEYSEWVGGAWYAGLVIWFLSKASWAWWWRALGKIGG